MIYLALLPAFPYREVCVGHSFDLQLLCDVKFNIMYQRFILRSSLMASILDARNLQNTSFYKYCSNVTTLTSCHFYHMLI